MPDASATSCALAWSGDLTSQFEKTAKGEKVVFLQINRKATLWPVGHFTIFVPDNLTMNSLLMAFPITILLSGIPLLSAACPWVSYITRNHFQVRISRVGSKL